MKTFKDLVFKPHQTMVFFDREAVQATITLPDGTAISVIHGNRDKTGFYCSANTYEVMSDRAYFDGVKGYQTKEQVTKHMTYCQRNPNLKRNRKKSEN